VLLDERLRVQVADVEILELRSELLTQLILGVAGDVAEITQHSGSLAREVRQLLGAEQDDGDDHQHQELGRVDVEHRVLTLPTSQRDLRLAQLTVPLVGERDPISRPV